MKIIPWIWWRDTGTEKIGIEIVAGKYSMSLKIMLWKKFLAIGWDF